jgi:hypothetical protein
VELRSH